MAYLDCHLDSRPKQKEINVSEQFLLPCGKRSIRRQKVLRGHRIWNLSIDYVDYCMSIPLGSSWWKKACGTIVSFVIVVVNLTRQRNKSLNTMYGSIEAISGVPFDKIDRFPIHPMPINMIPMKWCCYRQGELWKITLLASWSSFSLTNMKNRNIFHRLVLVQYVKLDFFFLEPTTT